MVKISLFAVVLILCCWIVWWLYMCAFIPSFQTTPQYITCWWFSQDRNRSNLDKGLDIDFRLAAVTLGNEYERDWVGVL